MGSGIDSAKLSSSLSEIQNRLEDLKTRCISDPGNAEEILSDALEQLQDTFEELSAADEELIQQNEELIVAQEALIQANDRLDMAQRAAGAVVWDWNIVTNHVEWSSEFFDLFGLDPQKTAATFEAWNTIIHPEDREIAIIQIDQALKEHSSLNSEYRIVLPNGQIHWISALGQGIYDDRARPVRMIGICIDITKRKKVEDELRKSEVKYRYLMENAPASIYEIDFAGTRFKLVNDSMCSILGYTREELMAMNPADLLDEKSQMQFRERIQKVIVGEPIDESVTYRVFRKDGQEKWVVINVNLIYTDGIMDGALVVAHDVTDRKRMEMALRESEQRFRLALRNAPVSVSAQDHDLRYTWAYNQRTARPEEIIGKLDADIFTPEEAERLSMIKRRVLDENVEVREQMWLDRQSGRMFLDVCFEPIRDESGRAIGVGTATVDLTPMKTAEEELRKSKDELEQRVQERTVELSEAKEDLEVINEELRVELEQHQKLEAQLMKAKEAAEEAAIVKSAFMANMSHELRTPMNYIIGMTSLLLDEPLTPELKDYVDTIRKGSDEMMALINNILDFTKVEKDREVLEYQPLSLSALVDESLEMVASKASKKSLNLSFNVNYGTPETIVGDYSRLRQILISLLFNAIKFTDEGDISLSVSSKPLQITNKHQILFAINDTGIGIPPEKMPELFQPFAQVETALSKKRDGIGLGLATNKKLVELMGGEIWAKSEVGKGSTFYFTIEAEIAPDDGIKPKPEGMTKAISGSKAIPDVLAEQHPLRILVAEDIPSNQKVLLEMLKRMGYRADAVADGKEVLQALEMRPYDLILMDVKMPEKDGIEAAKEIRRRWPDNGPKIIAITAYALHGDKEKCLAAGMDDYIAKPVQREDLAMVIEKYKQ